MELLKEFSESDMGVSRSDKRGVCYRLRKAARALVFNQEGQIALFRKKQTCLLFVSKHNYHKLPGGGVEKGEDLLAALQREVLEETGCSVEVRSQNVGIIIEYRDEYEELQISYCFVADVVGQPRAASFTEKEISDGFQLQWVNVDQAIDTLKSDQPDDYLGKFIKQRDLEFLLKAKEVLNN